jgi:stage II sporulation protein R
MKIWEKSLCLALVLTVLVSLTGFTAECENIPSHVLRLHILANSDSGADQALKLKVRDRILQESAGMLDGVKNREDAEKVVSQNLDAIQEIAQQEVYRQGYRYPVKVELTNMYFTTRQYDNVTLPAGMYDALRITIGSGNGHNWWCVIFPALCLPAAEAPSKISDVLDQNKTEMVCGENQYVVKFKVVELYEQFRSWMQEQPIFQWNNDSDDEQQVPEQISSAAESSVN